MSAISIHPSVAGLAVCRAINEVLDMDDSGAQPQQCAYNVDFEVLEDSQGRSEAPKELKKVYERMLNSSQLLAQQHGDTLVLLVQSDYPGRNSGAGWAQESSDAKIERYQTLKQLLQSKYPAAAVNSRAAKSMENAMKAVQQQQQQQSGGNASTPGVSGQNTSRPEFGTPEANKAYRKKKLNMRDAAADFLRSNQCLNPSAWEVFDSFLAQTKTDLADALWLAMYDVQQQMKEQQKRKRGRGADTREVYKANKRPTAATGPVSSLATGAVNLAVPTVGPNTPEQPMRHRGQRRAPAAAAAADTGAAAAAAAEPIPAQALVREVSRLIDLTAEPNTSAQPPVALIFGNVVDLTMEGA